MQRFKNILLVVDKRIESKAALEQTVALCKRNDAQLTVVDFVEEWSSDAEAWLTKDVIAELRTRELYVRETDLKRFIAPIQQEGVPVKCKILTGSPFLVIIQEVLRSSHDLVIMTADGDGSLQDRLFGSTSMHLMRKCPCPVWVIKQNQPRHFSRILAAVDLASLDDEKQGLDIKIMDLATSLAKLHDAQLHIVHSWLMPGEASLLSGRSKILRSDADKLVTFVEMKHKAALNKLLIRYDLENLDTKIHLLKGPATDMIPTVTEENDIDLIVMGTVARTGIAGFFIGNTAETVLNQVDSSVLTVKPDKFVTPIKLDESPI